MSENYGIGFLRCFVLSLKGEVDDKKDPEGGEWVADRSSESFWIFHKFICKLKDGKEILQPNSRRSTLGFLGWIQYAFSGLIKKENFVFDVLIMLLING